MKKFRYMLPIFLVALCILGLSFPRANAQNGALQKVRITGAPSHVQVCTEFQVGLVIEPLPPPYPSYDHFVLEVVVDTNYMKIVDFIVHEEGFTGPFVPVLSPDGSRFSLSGTLGYPWGSPWRWATLTIHCEGPGSSVIIFDRVETYVADGAEQFILEYEEPTVNQYAPAPTSYVVGGYSMPVSRLSIVAPHIALVALIVAITATVMIKKNRKL